MVPESWMEMAIERNVHGFDEGLRQEMERPGILTLRAMQMGFESA